jgi:hypothetical protein
MLAKEDLDKLSAHVRDYGNGWYAVDIYYEGKIVKSIEP